MKIKYKFVSYLLLPICHRNIQRFSQIQYDKYLIKIYKMTTSEIQVSCYFILLARI